MIWRKKCKHNYLPVDEPEPRILTGIEKHELELAEIAQQENNAKLYAIRKQIQELEAEIAPQVAVIEQLRAQITPTFYWSAHNALLNDPYAQYRSLPYQGLGASIMRGAMGGW